MSNIAVVVLDTLRQDYFESHFDWLPGHRFDNAWSPSHWTLPAHASLYTGKYPSEVGVHAESPILDCSEKVLAEHLQDAGYTTTAYTCNTVVADHMSFDRGYDDLIMAGYQHEKLRHGHDPDLYDWSAFIQEHSPSEAPWRYLRGVWNCLTNECDTLRSLYYGSNLKFDLDERLGRSSADIDMGAAFVLEELRNRDFGNDEFLYMNLMETHTPYRIPDDYKDVDDDAVVLPSNPVSRLDPNSNVDLEALRTRYQNAVQYLSDKYQEIFWELATDFEYIITLADHGELLGEHNHVEHATGLYPELTHIPLSVYSGESGISRRSTLVSLLDVHRTILELANIDATESRGRNLFDLNIRDTSVLTEYHGIPFPSKNTTSLQEWAGTTDLAESYQEWRRGIALPTDYYGYDTVNGFIETGELQADGVDPQAEIDRIAGEFSAPEQTTHDGEVSQDVEAELKNLGYIS